MSALRAFSRIEASHLSELSGISGELRLVRFTHNMLGSQSRRDVMIIANFGKFGIEPRRGDMVFANVRGRGFISPLRGFYFFDCSWFYNHVSPSGFFPD